MNAQRTSSNENLANNPNDDDDFPDEDSSIQRRSKSQDCFYFHPIDHCCHIDH